MAQISLSLSILKKQFSTSNDTNSHVSGVAEFYQYDNQEKDLVAKPIEFRASGLSASTIAALPELTFGTAVGNLEIVNRNLNRIPVINISAFVPTDLDYLLQISGAEAEEEEEYPQIEEMPQSGVVLHDVEQSEESEESEEVPPF
ncbi:MAG: hypothetical protein WBA41_21380 [Rivularia sp. (in: cyanobacteria)]